MPAICPYPSKVHCSFVGLLECHFATGLLRWVADVALGLPFQMHCAMAVHPCQEPVGVVPQVLEGCFA
uniref:Uncharacterized protein n=1 Tax=Parascaris equorum TaxID=6256 RepID=A0A914S633_PAREQ